MAGFTVTGQYLGIASSVDPQAVQSENDGIMGMFSSSCCDSRCSRVRSRESNVKISQGANTGAASARWTWESHSIRMFKHPLPAQALKLTGTTPRQLDK